MLESSTFPAQFLGTFRMIPDGGVFQLAAYFVEAFAFGVIVKDTPSGRRYALACL
jgi:hypothetical protein